MEGPGVGVGRGDGEVEDCVGGEGGRGEVVCGGRGGGVEEEGGVGHDGRLEDGVRFGVLIVWCFDGLYAPG